jgi:hypothetical protein
LLLVSPAFLGNTYITENELPRFVGGSKPCIPVTLRSIDLKTHDLRGLAPYQFFGYKPLRDTRARSFQECTSAKHRTAFAETLLNAIVGRLDKLFGSTTPAVGAQRSTYQGAASTIQRTFTCQFREFRGRSDDLKKLEHMLLKDQKCPGVVIGAFGGMGKTALANQFCTAYGVESFFNVIVGASAKKKYLDVDAFGLHDGGIRPTDHAVQTIRQYLLEVAAQLKLMDPGARPDNKLEDEIRAAVGGRRALFLLDNLETIDETTAALNLLSRLCSPPDQKFLITARKLPDSSGQGVASLPLNRLEWNDARLLVRDLLDDLDKKLAVSIRDDSAAISAILDQADGHPLALRLLTGKLVSQGEKAVLRMPDPSKPIGKEKWSQDLFSFVFDETFLTYLEPIAVDAACIIASYSHGLTERDLLAACQAADPTMTPEIVGEVIRRLLRTFCVHFERDEGEAVLAMHPLTREFFVGRAGAEDSP